MKGPRHGGANIKVAEMMDAVLEETGGYTADDKKIKTAVNKLMDVNYMTVPVLYMDLAMTVLYHFRSPCRNVKGTLLGK